MCTQNMEYKFLELLSCAFVASPEDMVRAQVGASSVYTYVCMRVCDSETRSTVCLFHIAGGTQMM